jgi:hypothetical protein
VRNLGFGVIEYDEEADSALINRCGILKVPTKFKGNDALMYMKDQLSLLFETNPFPDINHVVIEIPRAIFGANFNVSSIIPVGVVGGMLATYFDTEKVTLANPSEWNRGRKKDKTLERIMSIYGDFDEWDFIERPKNKVHLEHIVDAIGMAHWKLSQFYDYEGYSSIV